MTNHLIQRFKEKVKGQPLFLLNGPFSPLAICMPWTTDNDPSTCHLPFIFFNKGRETQGVMGEDNYKQHSKEVFGKYLNGTFDIAYLQGIYDESCKDINSLYEKVFTEDITSWDDATLAEAIGKSAYNLRHLGGRTLYIETFDKDIADEVAQGAQRAALDVVWERAVHPVFESFDVRRKRQLKEIVKQYGTGDEAARKATFIFTDYFLPKSISVIKDELSRADTTQEGATDVIKHDEKAQYETWLDTLPTGQKVMVLFVQFVMELRDLRKDPIAMSQATSAELAFEMIKRAGMPADITHAISAWEYQKGIQWLQDNKEELLKRADGVLFFIDDNGEQDSEMYVECVSSEVIKDDLTELLSPSLGSSEIKGQSASKGQYVGVVRVIRDAESPEAKDFQEGEILVTSMTRPEFVPLMKKAGAIITDEGGVTCHAAIVSRELRKPCIIGTKNATHVLKTGDRVEIDADKGVVHIITH